MKLVEYEKETFLWLSVIKFAQNDAEGVGFVDPMTQHLAIRWMTARSRAFDEVCRFAGLNAEQTKLLQEISRKKWLTKHKIN